MFRDFLNAIIRIGRAAFPECGDLPTSVNKFLTDFVAGLNVRNRQYIRNRLRENYVQKLSIIYDSNSSPDIAKTDNAVDPIMLDENLPFDVSAASNIWVRTTFKIFISLTCQTEIFDWANPNKVIRTISELLKGDECERFLSVAKSKLFTFHEAHLVLLGKECT